VCGVKIVTVAEYDHRIPDALGGSNEIDNCVCTCAKCHRVKTSTKDVPAIAKAVRLNEKLAGARKRTGFRKAPAGYKFSWKTGRMEKQGDE
jgi:5-methylcytosine-specific restriction endonuclease McrA